MNEAMRQEIVQRRQGGMSVRAIAAELGISRGAVTLRVGACKHGGRAWPRLYPGRVRARASSIRSSRS